jgi:hypothetical protein
MSRFLVALVGIASSFLVPLMSFAQQADAPIYKDGDWWRIKIEVTRPTGVSIAGPQLGGFPEYRVQINSGKPTVIGIRGEETKEIDAPPIISLVLGKTGWHGELLRFPVRVGLTWTDRFQFQPRGTQARWEEGRYEVQAWEKIKTPKGELDAFKIVMIMNVPTGPKGKGTAARTSTYYYAPEIKAIVSFREEGTEAALTSTLVEFNVSR